MATTSTTTRTARPTRTGRALAALLGGAIAVTAAYQATRSLPSQDPVAAIPADSTHPTADPFQVMADLTPVISAQMDGGAVAADPFQVMADLTPVVSAQMDSATVAADPYVGDNASSFGEDGLTGFVQSAVRRLDQS